MILVAKVAKTFGQPLSAKMLHLGVPLTFKMGESDVSCGRVDDHEIQVRRIIVYFVVCISERRDRDFFKCLRVSSVSDLPSACMLKRVMHEDPVARGKKFGRKRHACSMNCDEQI